MQNNEYQKFTNSMNIYSEINTKDKFDRIPYLSTLIPLVFGLTEEAGEVSGKFKKAIRDDYFDPEAVAKELGDCLWYLTEIGSHIGYSLESIMELNVKKLTDRKERNVLHGNGDNR